jgi:hypothetical protein
LNTVKKYLFFFLLLLTAILSGCATEFSGAAKTLAGQLEQLPIGSLHNPIIDSDISLSEALRKKARLSLKKGKGL